MGIYSPEHKNDFTTAQKGKSNELLKPFRSAYVEKNTDVGFQPDLIKFSNLRFPQQHKLAEHQHDWYEIIFVRKGSYSCLLNHELVKIKYKDALLIQPEDTHADFFQAQSEVAILAFNMLDLCGAKWNQPFFNRDTAIAGNRVFNLKKNQKIMDQLQSLIAFAEEQTDRALYTDEMAELLIKQILSALPSLVSAEIIDYSGHNSFSRVIRDFFTAHQQEQLDSSALAAGLGISRRSLEYKFKQYFGNSPQRAFLQYKLRLAAQLLRQGLSVKETAARLGFASQFTFSAAFKKVMGKSPSHFVGRIGSQDVL
ncbi:MAG TPA: hypothetical protein DC049_00195 [Spirochaetia bacterium]|nr:hypothetical protein [Spirochaetia bacterium]